MDPFIIYLLGYVLFWPKVSGMIAYSLAGGRSVRLDGFDITFGIFIGSLANLAWPVIIFGRTFYVLWVKFGLVDSNVLNYILPAPKPIETRQQKQARLQKEKDASIREQRREINSRERELDIPLTKWSN